MIRICSVIWLCTKNKTKKRFLSVCRKINGQFPFVSDKSNDSTQKFTSIDESEKKKSFLPKIMYASIRRIEGVRKSFRLWSIHMRAHSFVVLYAIYMYFRWKHTFFCSEHRHLRNKIKDKAIHKSCAQLAPGMHVYGFFSFRFRARGNMKKPK